MQWEAQESAFIAIVIKISEHTWGFDFKTYLNDTTNRNNDQFNKVRNGPKYQIMISSWEDQRNYLDYAIKLLDPSHPLRIKILDNFNLLEERKKKSTKVTKWFGSQQESIKYLWKLAIFYW